MTPVKEPVATRLVLRADTAADLMSYNPISVRHDAGVREAVVLMTDRDVSAAPVIDDNGRAVGVITITDILVHDREFAWSMKLDDGTRAGDARRYAAKLPPDMEIEVVDPTRVEEIMTPTVFAVKPDTPAAEVVRAMMDMHVHHLFVADDEGTLVGVISAGDVLRRLA